MNTNENTPKIVTCKCCGMPIVIALQERRAPKSPMLLITCENEMCQLHMVTLAALEIADYVARDLGAEGKYDINK